MTHTQKVIYIAVNKGGNREDEFTKFPVTVVVLANGSRTYSKERMNASREMLSTDLKTLGCGVGATFQLVP